MFYENEKLSYKHHNTITSIEFPLKFFKSAHNILFVVYLSIMHFLSLWSSQKGGLKKKSNNSHQSWNVDRICNIYFWAQNSKQTVCDTIILYFSYICSLTLVFHCNWKKPYKEKLHNRNKRKQIALKDLICTLLRVSTYAIYFLLCPVFLLIESIYLSLCFSYSWISVKTCCNSESCGTSVCVRRKEKKFLGTRCALFSFYDIFEAIIPMYQILHQNKYVFLTSHK